MRTLSNILLTLRICGFAATTPFLFRLPIRRIASLVTPPSRATPVDPAEVTRVIRITDALCRILRPLLSHPCQLRGLTLYHFLRRCGLDVSLVFGIDPQKSPGVGHCWLTLHAEPFLQATDPRRCFTPVVSIGGPPDAGEHVRRMGGAGE